MKTVEMPKMGDTMETGKILRWLKKEGESVRKGDSLAEVETEKVNIEIEAFAAGILRKILVPAGTSASVGAGIALIGAADEPLPGSSSSATKPAVTVPTMEVLEKAETTGAAPAQNSSLATKQAGTPLQAANGSSITSQQFSPVSLNTFASSTSREQGRIFISPIARRLAEEHQIDFTQISGTGPNGRIIKMDVEAAVARNGGQQLLTPAVPATAVDEVVEIPLSPMRRTIARRLSQSMQTAPHFYVTSIIDTGKLAVLRQQINEYTASDQVQVKVSFNDLIIKAVALALVRMPRVNVSFAEDKLLQKKQVHIGVAVALDEGLIVPVLRNAEQRGILEIARESRRLAEAARSGKLHPEDFSGGTFTISNLGMFDVDSFTAVINPPESAILAVGSITPTPVVIDGQVTVRERMKVTLSSDHRAIDGATAARFLQEIKRLLEEPLGLLL